MMSIKTVNALATTPTGLLHTFTPVHWVRWAFVTMGSVYLYDSPLSSAKMKCTSAKLVEAHFWIATISVVLYIAAIGLPA